MKIQRNKQRRSLNNRAHLLSSSRRPPINQANKRDLFNHPKRKRERTLHFSRIKNGLIKANRNKFPKASALSSTSQSTCHYSFPSYIYTYIHTHTSLLPISKQLLLLHYTERKKIGRRRQLTDFPFKIIDIYAREYTVSARVEVLHIGKSR